MNFEVSKTLESNVAVGEIWQVLMTRSRRKPSAFRTEAEETSRVTHASKVMMVYEYPRNECHASPMNRGE